MSLETGEYKKTDLFSHFFANSGEKERILPAFETALQSQIFQTIFDDKYTFYNQRKFFLPLLKIADGEIKGNFCAFPKSIRAGFFKWSIGPISNKKGKEQFLPGFPSTKKSNIFALFPIYP